METLIAAPEFTLNFNGVNVDYHRASVTLSCVTSLGYASKPGESPLIRHAEVCGSARIGTYPIEFTGHQAYGDIVENLMKHALAGNVLACHVALHTSLGGPRLVGIALTEHRFDRRRWALAAF